MVIYLLDQDQEAVNKVTGLLAEIGLNDCLKVFSSSNSLLAELNRQKEVKAVFIRLGETNFNGLEVAKKIIAVKQKSAVIFISRYPAYASLAWQVGAAGFLTEPLDSYQFYLTLSKLSGGRGC